MLIKNSFFLAKNSISNKKSERFEQTIERYRNFASLFPDSDFFKSLTYIESESEKELNVLTKRKSEQ
jgi:hypothetical protein